jgi:hypothetical protein
MAMHPTTHTLNQCEVLFFGEQLIIIRINISYMLLHLAPFIDVIFLATAPPQQPTVLRLMGLAAPVEIVFFLIFPIAIHAHLNFVILSITKH